MNAIKKPVDKVIRKMVNHLYHNNVMFDIPRGNNVFRDIRKCLYDYDPRVVLDVGANVGQSAKLFKSEFPSAEIYCFEPVESTFQQLIENVTDVNYYQIALGSTDHQGQMVLQGTSDLFFLYGQSKRKKNGDVLMEDVQVTTVDKFCQENKIGVIDYLKIDTEGGDLDVLYGAKDLLLKNRVAFIQVEASMNPFNIDHVPLEDFMDYLRTYGYYLFSIYEQAGESIQNNRILRRVNPVFINRYLV